MAWTHTGHPGRKSEYTYEYECPECGLKKRYVGTLKTHYCNKCKGAVVMERDPISGKKRD